MSRNVVSYRNKEEYVHEVFSAIAYRYDLLNSLLSFNRDKYWRRFTVGKSGLQPGGKGLDVCCGTAMLAIEQAKVVGPKGKIVGLDFCENMLDRARANISKTPYNSVITLVQGNATELTFPEHSFDCATTGFALRNVPDIKKTIQEMRRVVRPGGKVVSLELSKPGAPLFKQLYYLYFNHLVPVLGRLGIGTDGPYSYLPNSLKNFPHQEEIKALFEDVGLNDVHYYELTGGIVSVHVGTV
jgi:demethylmenaquinone methyltransferase/2-methoxy-6-polyprenyl-1,4-benzoquinol methylase